MSGFVDDPFESAQEQDAKLNIDDFKEIYELADSGQRFVNFLIDLLVSYALMFAGGMMIGVLEEVGAGDIGTILFLIMLFMAFAGYYAIMEKIFGQTLGKMVSKTRVVDVNGGPISWGQAIGRTFARRIPFEPFSILFSSKSIGWHDSLASTRVIRDRRGL